MRHRKRHGFTLPELLIVVSVVGILVLLGANGVRAYGQQQRSRQAAQMVLWEAHVTRSYALRTGQPVALVADEPARTLVIRDAAGKVWRTTAFADLGVRVLDVGTSGDSLAFSSRGLCLNCAGDAATAISVRTGDRRARVRISVLGRLELTREPDSEEAR